MIVKTQDTADVNSTEEETMIKNGLEVCKADEEDVRLIKRMMGSDSHKFVKAWKVRNKRKEDDLRKYLESRGIKQSDR